MKSIIQYLSTTVPTDLINYAGTFPAWLMKSTIQYLLTAVPTDMNKYAEDVPNRWRYNMPPSIPLFSVSIRSGSYL